VPVTSDYLCERALLPEGVRDNVVVSCAEGTIVAVSVGADPGAAHRLAGLVLPGFANTHSHAFHRALRGRTHGGGGTFWTWRETMYQLAARLDPDSYYRLARLVFAEMVGAGFTSVGEFHYLHHQPDGTPYAEPNAMGHALVRAAEDAGIRLTLLDTCYLTGGIDAPLIGVQRRFGDGDVLGWLDRMSGFGPGSARLGAAIHSVRAVPAAALGPVASWAAENDGPLHVHLSEQPAENDACRAAYGRTPTELLHEHGALTGATVAVHATHLTSSDITMLGRAGATACFCPTTEADLADGIGPARELLDAGAALALGTDQHAVIDPFLEIRGLEHGERLRTGQRGRFAPAELLTAATVAGHAALGRPTGGRIALGAPADLVAVRTDSPRTAGSLPDQVVLTANSSDVDSVVVDGGLLVDGGEHCRLGPVGPLLTEAINAVWR
jgi:formiminoglutamate deiminase